jgi:hypothetical protein
VNPETSGANPESSGVNPETSGDYPYISCILIKFRLFGFDGVGAMRYFPDAAVDFPGVNRQK